MASNTIAESGMARVLKGELCISGKLLRSSSYEGAAAYLQVMFDSEMSERVCPGTLIPRRSGLTGEVELFRQHKAANFRHRAELLYLESWKGKRFHAANLPRSGI